MRPFESRGKIIGSAYIKKSPLIWRAQIKHSPFVIMFSKTDWTTGTLNGGCQTIHCHRDLKRFLSAPATPSRHVPSKNMLAGSGTAGLLVICPCTVVIPLFEAGGTRFSGLLVIA